jgi:hypothetical protein
MLSDARARNDDDFSSDFSAVVTVVAGDPDRGVDCAEEFVDMDSALGFFCAVASGPGDCVPVGGVPPGGVFCSLPLLPLRRRSPSAVPGRSIGEDSSDVGDSRSVSPDNLPFVLLPSSPLPFLSFLLNSPLSIPGFFSFLLPLLGFGSAVSSSRLGPLSREVLAVVEEVLLPSVSRKIFGVNVILRVSMLSSLKKESVLRGVPFLDCF